MAKIKTILVHLAHDEDHLPRFRISLGLARKHGAHLIALYNPSPVGSPLAGRGASMHYIAEATAIAHEKGKAVRAEVEEACQKAGVSAEWRLEEGEHLDVLAHHAAYADLVIVSHAKADEREDRIVFHAPENLVLKTGCPVLVLPHPCPSPDHVPGSRVLIAWKPSRGSLRAVRDALPFLQSAEKVLLLCVSKGKKGEDVPGAEIAAMLDRHGVSVEIMNDRMEGHENIGKTILFHAKSCDADLIVMGAYGHSLIHEALLGSTTKHVTAHMTVPVLLAH